MSVERNIGNVNSNDRNILPDKKYDGIAVIGEENRKIFENSGVIGILEIINKKILNDDSEIKWGYHNLDVSLVKKWINKPDEYIETMFTAYLSLNDKIVISDSPFSRFDYGNYLPDNEIEKFKVVLDKIQRKTSLSQNLISRKTIADCFTQKIKEHDFQLQEYKLKEEASHNIEVEGFKNSVVYKYVKDLIEKKTIKTEITKIENKTINKFIFFRANIEETIVTGYRYAEMIENFDKNNVSIRVVYDNNGKTNKFFDIKYINGKCHLIYEIKDKETNSQIKKRMIFDQFNLDFIQKAFNENTQTIECEQWSICICDMLWYILYTSNTEKNTSTNRNEIDKLIDWTKKGARVDLEKTEKDQANEQLIKDVLKENDPQGEVDELIKKINSL